MIVGHLSKNRAQRMLFQTVFNKEWINTAQFDAKTTQALHLLWDFLHENVELFGENDVFTADNHYLWYGLRRFASEEAQSNTWWYHLEHLGREYGANEFIAQIKAAIARGADFTEIRKILVSFAQSLPEAPEKPLSWRFDDLHAGELGTASDHNFYEISTPPLDEHVCKLHISTEQNEVGNLFNAISGQLLRYFNRFKITTPDYDFHNHPRMKHGGQITIYLNEHITIHYLQKVLPKISARLTQKKITPGHLDSDAATHFNYFSMRYDGGTDSEYLPAEFTGRNYNPYNQSTPFNNLIKAPDAFSLLTHFLKFNLTYDSGKMADKHVQICIAAYLREIGKDEEAVLEALTDPSCDKRDILGDQAAWRAAIRPDLQPMNFDDVEYLRIVYRYLEDNDLTVLSFSTLYPGTHPELKAFFAAIENAFSHIKCDPKATEAFALFYLEQLSATAQQPFPLATLENASKVLRLFQILEIPLSQPEALIAQVTRIVDCLANNQPLIQSKILAPSQVMQIGDVLFGAEENNTQLSYRRPNYKIDYEKLLRTLLNDHIKTWDLTTLCLKLQAELTTQATAKTLTA